MPIEQPAVDPNSNNQFSHDLFVSVKELFYAYDQRQSSDNRSAQTHIGPSEIGTPCDRRIAMKFMGIPPVNEGGDGFAAWLGTQGHRGAADLFRWAGGVSGRFSVETPLIYLSSAMPGGTADLLDRRYRVLIDHKFMGHWSLKHLRDIGPSETYRVQVHTYGYGARLAGEFVSHVALIGWPRQGASLDEMYVWSEPYDEQIAVKGLARIEGIAAYVDSHQADTQPEEIISSLNTAKDCTYCAYHLTHSHDLARACPGNNHPREP
jgi:hypothetical protein